MHSKEETHIILASFPIYGHVRPLCVLARELVELGHSVTFVSGSMFKGKIEEIPGVEFVPLQGDADFDYARLGINDGERYRIPAGPPRLLWDQEHVFIADIAEQHNTVQDILRRPELKDKKPVIVAESCFFGNLPMLLGSPYARRVPVIVVGTVPFLGLSKDTPGFGKGLPNLGWKKNAEHNRELMELSHSATSALEDILEPFACTQDLPSGCPLDNTILTADVYFQLGVPAIEPRRRDLPKQVRFAGLLHGSNTKTPHPDWFEDFVVKGDRTQPLILVTSGTLPNLPADELILPSIEACKDLRVRVIVCAVEVPFPSGLELPKNVRWSTWIAFEELLPHVSFIIASGGYNGVNQAFAHGIPMILAGESEDKKETCFRAALTGAAINLQTQTPSVQQVEGAVRKMLRDPSYRTKATELKKSYETHNAPQLIIGTMHELISEFAEADSESAEINNAMRL